MNLGPELSTEEREAIEAECRRYPQRRAAAIEALMVVQKRRGWVSDGSLKALADFMEMSEAELEGLATFYNLIFRQPVGRHVIRICDSICCWIKDAEGINRHLCQRLGIQPGETTADGRFTLLPQVCLGDCDHAPTLMIDDEQHGDLTPEKIDRLLTALQTAEAGHD